MRFLRGLGGRVLPCGCLVGVYETYNGSVVSTVDARGPECGVADHQLHRILEASPDSTGPSADRPLGSALTR